MKDSEIYDVLVVGAGMAGLAAAHLLHSEKFQVRVFERCPKAGGRAVTSQVDDLSVDVGAAFISDFYLETLKLVHNVGVTNSLVRRSQTVYIARSDQTSPMWPVKELIHSPALSLGAKIRLLGLIPPLVRRWKKLDIFHLDKVVSFDRETAGQFSNRALGSESSEFFFAPLLRGLLYWDVDTTSSVVALSVLKAFLNSKATYRFKGGFATFTQALSRSLPITYSADVTEVVTRPDGLYEVRAEQEGKRLSVVGRSVVCAVPTPFVVEIAKFLPVEALHILSGVAYSSTAVITYESIGAHDDYLRGAILFPATAVQNLASVNPFYQYVDGAGSNSGALGQSRLFNVALSSEGGVQTRHMSDAELARVTLAWVRETLGKPRWSANAHVKKVQRWPLALPRFGVGHVVAMKKLEQIMKQAGRFRLAGDYLEGPYIDGAVRSGLAAAGDIIESLKPKG